MGVSRHSAARGEAVDYLLLTLWVMFCEHFWVGVLRGQEGIAPWCGGGRRCVASSFSVFLAVADSSGGGGYCCSCAVVLFCWSSHGGLVFHVPSLERVDRLPTRGCHIFHRATMVYAWSAGLSAVSMITGSFCGVFAGRSSVHHRILKVSVQSPMVSCRSSSEHRLHANIWALDNFNGVDHHPADDCAVISKVIGSGFGRLGGFSNGESLRLGIGMISRGEVGLIVAQLLVAQSVVPKEIITVAVIMVLVTTLVTPPLLRTAFVGREATADGASAR